MLIPLITIVIASLTFTQPNQFTIVIAEASLHEFSHSSPFWADTQPMIHCMWKALC